MLKALVLLGMVFAAALPARADRVAPKTDRAVHRAAVLESSSHLLASVPLSSARLKAEGGALAREDPRQPRGARVGGSRVWGTLEATEGPGDAAGAVQVRGRLDADLRRGVGQVRMVVSDQYGPEVGSLKIRPGRSDVRYLKRVSAQELRWSRATSEEITSDAARVRAPRGLLGRTLAFVQRGPLSELSADLLRHIEAGKPFQLIKHTEGSIVQTTPHLPLEARVPPRFLRAQPTYSIKVAGWSKQLSLEAYLALRAVGTPVASR